TSSRHSSPLSSFHPSLFPFLPLLSRPSIVPSSLRPSLQISAFEKKEKVYLLSVLSARVVESSVEYRDSTGVDLHRFIVDTLNSNPRDRMMMLKLEQDMVTFITGESTFKKFPHMSSYHRMLVHRVAAFFGMEHNVDQTGKSVIINRTSNTRIPAQRFVDQVQDDKAAEIPHWKSILKRNSSTDEQTRRHTLRDKQSKSMEEREEEYQKVRERIFNQEVRRPTSLTITRIQSLTPILLLHSFFFFFLNSSSRQSSTETDCRYANEPRPWSSTDSDSSSCQWTATAPKPRPHPAANPGWEPHGTPAHPAYILENGIPPGSILVNPHTGQPFLNPDGSPVVYNPPGAQQPIRSQMHGAPAQQPTQQAPLPMEDLSQQFAHVAVSCQSAGEAAPICPPAQGYVFAAPPPPSHPPVAPQVPNPHNYCQPSPQVGKNTHIKYWGWASTDTRYRYQVDTSHRYPRQKKKN
uniref:cAMP-regulated phosphoprotein, 21 n=1 Tax=Hippocampus comes TaxID=109280 RepID=A0A3Q2XGX2_HIPCM